MKPSISTACLAALHAGNKMEAIKLLRNERGIGLKEAKDEVEAYVDAHPDLKSQLETQSAASMGKLKWILLAVVLAGLAYLFSARSF